MTNTRHKQNRRTRPGLIVLIGAATLTLAACSGNGSASNYIPAAGSPSQAQRAPQGAFGTIAAVTGSNVEVQNPQNGQVTVNFTSSTTFDTVVPATLQDVTVGSCVTVTPAANAPAGQTVSAGTVMISQPAANGCPRAGGLGGGFAGGGQGNGRPGGGANPSRRGRPSGQPNPNGPRGAFGSVTAVNGNTFTVHNTVPANGNAPADTTVTIDPSTMFTKSVSADSHALVVGKCAAALGPMDSTGAVSARSMTISTPGPNGCAAFGARQGRGGQNGGGNG
jgi:hypothetical protein